MTSHSLDDDPTSLHAHGYNHRHHCSLTTWKLSLISKFLAFKCLKTASPILVPYISVVNYRPCDQKIAKHMYKAHFICYQKFHCNMLQKHTSVLWKISEMWQHVSKSKHQKMTDLAASKWIMTPGVGLAPFTGKSLCERRTDTLAGHWVTDVSRPSALGTFCSQTKQQHPLTAA